MRLGAARRWAPGCQGPADHRKDECDGRDDPWNPKSFWSMESISLESSLSFNYVVGRKSTRCPMKRQLPSDKSFIYDEGTRPQYGTYAYLSRIPSVYLYNTGAAVGSPHLFHLSFTLCCRFIRLAWLHERHFVFRGLAVERRVPCPFTATEGATAGLFEFLTDH